MRQDKVPEGRRSPTCRKRWKRIQINNTDRQIKWQTIHRMQNIAQKNVNTETSPVMNFKSMCACVQQVTQNKCLASAGMTDRDKTKPNIF